MLTAMSFLKQRYMAKAIHEQEAKRIANAVLLSRCKLACKSPFIVNGRFGEIQTPEKTKLFQGGLDETE